MRYAATNAMAVNYNTLLMVKLGGADYATANRKPLTISPNAACTNNRGHTGFSLCSRGSTSSSCEVIIWMRFNFGVDWGSVS